MKYLSKKTYCLNWTNFATRVVIVTVFNNCVCVCVQSLSCVQFFATPSTVPLQVPLSMGFSRQEYWNGLPFPTPGDLPNPGIKPTSLASPALASRFFTTAPPGKPHLITVTYTKSETGPDPGRATLWITKVWKNILTDLLGTPCGTGGKKYNSFYNPTKLSPSFFTVTYF